MDPDQGKPLDWMYEGPNSLVNREDYLLGRKVDKAFQMMQASESGGTSAWMTEAEKDLTPGSILKPSGPAGPVDIVRKVKDDPLFQIQKKEQEYRKQLLLNPVLMKKLQKQHGITPSSSSTKSSAVEASGRKPSKHKKHKHKKHSGDTDSDSSSSDDEAVNKIFNALTKGQDHKKKEPSRYSRDDRDRERSRDDYKTDRRGRERDDDYSSRRRTDYDDRSSSDRRHSKSHEHRHQGQSSFSSHSRRSRSRTPPRRDYDHGRDRREKPSYDDRKQELPHRRREIGGPSWSRESPLPPPPPSKPKLSEEEMERRRQEMMGFAVERDEERQKVVEKHREEIRKEHELLEKNRQQIETGGMAFINKQLSEAARTGSVAQRVKSNAYNIQRSKSAMDSNFARR